jgi:hypothetical protein
MGIARRLRRRASAALKVAGAFDETVAEEGSPKGHSQLPLLQEAAKDVESVETAARMLIGRFLGEDERIAGLKARLRQEIIQELLDIVNAFVDPGTYQKIRKQLLKSEPS